MESLTEQNISFFDTGRNSSERVKPEHFFHGLVLGLLVDLHDRYELKSNRESGFGRYDVILKPLDYTRNPKLINILSILFRMVSDIKLFITYNRRIDKAGKISDNNVLISIT